MQNVVRRFVDDARTILAHGPTDDALAQLMARMRLLIRHPTVLEDHEAFLARSATDGSPVFELVVFGKNAMVIPGQG